MKNQCEAITAPSTYSQAHRCLKKAKKLAGGRRLCPHHLRAAVSQRMN